MSGGTDLMARKALRKRSKAAKIETIIETTRRLIGEKGYVATTTNHIAKAADVSIGLVYKYFPFGKASIAYQISLRDHTGLVRIISAAQTGRDDLPERLYNMLVAWIRQHQKNEPFLRAMNIAMLSSPEHFKAYTEEVMETIAEKAHNLFWSTQSEGLDRPELKKLTLTLFHTIESVVHRHVLLKRMFDTDEELAKFLTDMVLGVIENQSRPKQRPEAHSST